MRTLNKITATIICLSIMCFSLSMVDVSAESSSDLSVQIDNDKIVTIKDTDGDSYYEISSADELYAFAQIVNNGNTSINAILTDNIVVNEESISESSTSVRVWTPIAEGPLNGQSSNYNKYDLLYNGIFDGNGKTISGLYCNNSEDDYIGLFAGLESNGIIKNLTISNSYFNGYEFVGAFASFSKGTITNCINKSTIEAFSIAGGITGCTGIYTKSVVSYCKNYGKIKAAGLVGGITGNNCVSISYCENNGSVTGTACTGGISGCNNGTINNCVNNETINSYSYLSYVTPYNMGGISGDTYNGSINYCINNGYVNCSSGNYAGGIVGDTQYSTISNCLNTGKVSGFCMAGIVSNSLNDKIENCCNTYYLNGASSYCNILNIYKDNEYKEPSDSVKNCYYYDGGNTECVSIENHIEAKTSEQFASGEVAYLLQGNQNGQIWGQIIGSDSHPILYGKSVIKTSDNKYSNT